MEAKSYNGFWGSESEPEESPNAPQDAAHPTPDSSDTTQNTPAPPEGPPRSRPRLEKKKPRVEKKKGKQPGRERILSTIERVSLSLENDMERKRSDDDLTRQVKDLKHEFEGSFNQEFKAEIRKDIKEELKNFMGELGTILKHRDAPSDAWVSGSTFRYSSNSIGSILYRRLIVFPCRQVSIFEKIIETENHAATYCSIQ